MIVAIDVEDESWNVVPGLEERTRGAIAAALAAAGHAADDAEVSILFLGDGAMADLNARWRGKSGPTNVLSFPAEAFAVPPGAARPLGDIALAFGVSSREAIDQGKTLPEHMMHLIVHGLLHLLGFDHVEEAEAAAMERLEADILKGLGIADPYERH